MLADFESINKSRLRLRVCVFCILQFVGHVFARHFALCFCFVLLYVPLPYDALCLQLFCNAIALLSLLDSRG